VYILYFNRSLIEINSPLVRPTAGILETPAALSVLTSADPQLLGFFKVLEPDVSKHSYGDTAKEGGGLLGCPQEEAKDIEDIQEACRGLALALAEQTR
jgi:hypothetical protein